MNKSLKKKLINNIKYFIKLIINLIDTKSLHWARILMNYNISSALVSINQDAIQIKKYSLSIKNKKHYFLLDCIDYIDLFNSKLNANFFIENDNFYIQWNQFKLNITTKEEFFIISEIFLKKIYNFNFNQPFIVIDIGFNVGIASLFFAKNNFVKKIYAYEPVDETFNQGRINLGLNKELSKKIIVYNYGISNEEGYRIIDFLYNNKGSIGKYGLDLKSQEGTIKKRILIKRFIDEYSKIVEETGSKDEILIKIDCEGDEYEIIKSFKLIKSTLPKIIMIEWHKQGPESLIKELEPLGYSIFSFAEEKLHRGNLYCIKS